jgi:hypothetical protein
MTQKQIERWYDFLYAKADEIVTKHNPCGITSENVSCIGYSNEYPHDPYTSGQKNKGCCRDCCYLSYKGCKVKALKCKLYLCSAATDELRKRNPLALFQLRRLQRIANRLDFTNSMFWREAKWYVLQVLTSEGVEY